MTRAIDTARESLEAMESFAGAAEDRGDDVTLYMIAATITRALLSVAEAVDDLGEAYGWRNP